jgi:glycosyltransferase involved in cell wall biosynthesis
VGLHQDAAVVVVSAPLVADGPLPGFLHAAALVSERVANVEFAVLGEGPDAEALKALAHELRLSGSTTFLGQRPDSRDVMAAGNIVAVIADDAGGQVQALAGLAAGLRLVAADTPAARELVRGVPSIPLVDLGDPQAFADAILEQLEGLTVEEEEIQANTGMAWGLSEVLASQDEFDLDRPGLDPRDRGKEATSDIERLLAQHSVEAMVVGTMRVYEEVLGTASA